MRSVTTTYSSGAVSGTSNVGGLGGSERRFHRQQSLGCGTSLQTQALQ